MAVNRYIKGAGAYAQRKRALTGRVGEDAAPDESFDKSALNSHFHQSDAGVGGTDAMPENVARQTMTGAEGYSEPIRKDYTRNGELENVPDKYDNTAVYDGNGQRIPLRQALANAEAQGGGDEPALRDAVRKHLSAAGQIAPVTNAEKVRDALTEKPAVDEKPVSWREAVTDKGKQDKRERTRRMVSAIGDVLRRMGNLYYTNRYATPQQYAYDPYKQWKQDEKEQQAYDLAKQRIQTAKDKADADNIYKMQNLELARQNAEGKAKLNDANIALKNQQAKVAEQNALLKQLAVETEPEKQQAILERLKELGRKAKADADKAEQNAKDQGAINQSKINRNNAAAGSSAASAAYKRTQTGQLKEGTIEQNENTTTVKDNKGNVVGTKKITNKKVKQPASKKEAKSERKAMVRKSMAGGTKR